MIKITYDPIIGARCIFDDGQPSSQQTEIYTNATKIKNEVTQVRAKHLRQTNTKQK